MAARHCTHIRKDGQPCQGFATTESMYCFMHDPAQAAKRAEARRQGGKAGRVTILPDSELSVRTPEDIVNLLELTINDVRSGRVDVKIANAVANLINIASRAIEQATMATYLEAIEGVLEPGRRRVLGTRKNRRT